MSIFWPGNKISLEKATVHSVNSAPLTLAARKSSSLPLPQGIFPISPLDIFPRRAKKIGDAGKPLIPEVRQFRIFCRTSPT